MGDPMGGMSPFLHWRERTLVALRASLAVSSLAWLGLALQGCAQVTVLRVNAVQPASYLLQGPHLHALQREAAARCPQGHEVHRLSDKAAGPEADWPLPRWWNLAMQRVDDDDRRAQMAITCR